MKDVRSRYDRLKAEWQQLTQDLAERRNYVSAHALRAWRKRRAFLSRQINELRPEVARVNKLQPTLFS